MLVNIITQSRSVPNRVGNTDNVTWENSMAMLSALGWREMPDEPSIESGYVRMSCVAIEDDGVNGKWNVVDRLQSELATEEAASEKARLVASLSPSVIAIAQAYRIGLRSLFGSGAETNRNVTRAAVLSALLAQDPSDYDAKLSDILVEGYKQITDLTGTGETWTFYETVGDQIP